MPGSVHASGLRFVWQIRRGAQILAQHRTEAEAVRYASGLASAEHVNRWLIDEPGSAMMLLAEHQLYVH